MFLHKESTVWLSLVTTVALLLTSKMQADRIVRNSRNYNGGTLAVLLAGLFAATAGTFLILYQLNKIKNITKKALPGDPRFH